MAGATNSEVFKDLLDQQEDSEEAFYDDDGEDFNTMP